MIIDIVCTFSATTIEAEAKSISLVLTFPVTQLPSNICDDVKTCLGISSSGSNTKYLNEEGLWTTPAGGGGVSDGNKGDVTVSGSGATWEINNDAVTNDKIDSVDATKVNEDTTHRFVTDTEKSTWNGKQDALGYTPEDVANKENTTLDTSTTKYPTNNLVKTYVDTQVANAPTLISTATASTSATIDFTLPSGYKSFEIRVISLIPSTDNVGMWIRVSTDGGATFAAGASDYVYQRNIQNGTTAAPVLSSPDTKIVTLGFAIGNGSGRYFNSIIKVFDPSNASINKNISVDFYTFRSDSIYSIGFVNGVYKFNTAINAIRILMSSGNIASGTFELWGYK